MMRRLLHTSAEQRLLHKGDLKQFGKDLNEFHVRTDDPIATAGSVVMAPAALILKGPNALVGAMTSDQPAEPLGEGPIKYTVRDVKSLAQNTLAAAGNLLTLHPLRATGNVIKGGFDAWDLATTDIPLDLASDIVGHVNRKTRSRISASLSAAA